MATKDEKSNIWSADSPMIDPKDDRLGYAQFSAYLAESICKMTPSDGLVIAIYGSWGLGKSTVLNFVEYYLNKKPESQKPVVIRFNPWWFSGQEDLTKRFFDRLQVVLKNRKIASAKISEQIADFAEAVGEIPIPVLSAGKGVSKLARTFRKDVVALKGAVEDALKKQKRRILVIIDDIDRLTAEEIRQLFTVIKTVANFPNVVYLLAFDRTVVVRALEQMQGLPGEDYLEKIVQVSRELPVQDKTSLRRLLDEKVNAVIGNTPQELFDQEYWFNVYFEGIDHFVTTPRDIARLANTLTLSYPAVEGEVNAVDFIAMESLQIFCPHVYRVIRSSPDMFTEHIDMGSLLRGRKDNPKLFHDSWLNQLAEEDRTPIQKLLKRIFPKLGSVWGNVQYSDGQIAAWRKQSRVCSAEKFPIYFRLAVPEGNISNFEMMSLLSLLSNSDVFAAKLLELAGQKRPDGSTRVSVFLERLLDYAQSEISVEDISPTLGAFFVVGDQLLLPEDESRGMFILGRNDVRMGRVIWQLLSRLDEPQRFSVLKDAILNGNAISMMVAEITSLGHQHGKYAKKQPDPESERLINAQHLEELEDLVLEKIRETAQRDLLRDTPQLPQVLDRWCDWSDSDEVKQWVQGITKIDRGLAEFFAKFYQWTDGRIDPQSLESFLEPSQIIERARNLAGDTRLPENQRIAARQFVKGYELRQQGKNPRDPFAWIE